MNIKETLNNLADEIISAIEKDSVFNAKLDADLESLKEQVASIRKISNAVSEKREFFVRCLVSLQNHFGTRGRNISLALSEQEIALNKRIKEMEEVIEKERLAREEERSKWENEVAAVEKSLEHLSSLAARSTSSQILIYIEQTEDLVIDDYFRDKKDYIQSLKEATLDNLKHHFAERAEKERLAYEGL